MDDLTTLANQRGRGFRIFQGLIAEDATGPNDTVPVRIPAYDPSRQFGPCHWSPRTLNDGSPLWPNRNDECLVALDENDQAEIINWWAEDPTSISNRWVEYGPFLANPLTTLAAGAEVSVNVAVGVGLYPYDPSPPEFVVSGHLQGTDAHRCTWGVETYYDTSVQIRFRNASSGLATPVLKFTLKMKAHV